MTDQSPTYKAIETQYAGHRFRSRLEARHAVFFNRLNIDWVYEAEGFEVGPDGHRRRYLPDFYLPQQRTWIEVKGAESALDFDLLVDAAHPRYGLPLSLDADDADWPLVKIRMIVFGSLPEVPRFHWALSVVSEKVAVHHVTPCCVPPVLPNEPHTHVIFPVNTPVEVHPAEEAGKRYLKPNEMLKAFGYGFPCPDIAEAYTAARSARFEYGEQG